MLALEDINEAVGPIIQKDPRKKDLNFFRCEGSDPDVQYIKAYYGLDTLPTHQLITQDP